MNHGRVGRVGDVVLTDVAVQPVREVEETVVHREHEIGDQARHRKRPSFELDGLDRDHLIGRPGAVRAAPVPHRARQGRSDEALVCVGVVEPTDLERDEAGLAEIQRLLDDQTTSSELRARLEEERRTMRASIEGLRDRAGLMDAEVDSLEARIDRAYNAHWGSCLREGNENSRFGEQVNDYADLYTSRVSNFGPYSPLRYFRAPRRPMPHEV